MRTADVLAAAGVLQRTPVALGYPPISTMDAWEATERMLTAANPMRHHPAGRACAVCAGPVQGPGRWCSESCHRDDDLHGVPA